MRALTCVLAAASMAACGGKKADEAATPSAAELVARGRYLAGLGGCAACHTAVGPTGPDTAHAYAGGLEMPDTFGTWRTPNITQDKATGIGTWTDDQIARGIREGVRPDGSRLYPIMPYLLYNRLTDGDTHALVAYLRTIPAVARASSPNHLALPQPPAPVPANEPDFTDDPVRHGDYLAHLMLCSHCHATPGPGGAPEPAKAFAGGLKFELPMMGSGALYAANLTSDLETGIGKWSEVQIATAIQTMTRPDGRIIQGPMQFLAPGWSQLTEADRKAVAVFLHQLPPVKNPVPASTFQPATH